MSDNAAQQPPYTSHPQPGPAAQPAFNQFLPSGPDRPTPIGLGVAGAGLLLLAVGSLIKQLSITGDEDDLSLIAGSSMEFGGVGLPALAPALILVVLVGWAAAGIKPGLQWAAKLGGIGIALITAAAALHPVIEISGVLGSEAWEDSDLDVDVSAGGGIWLTILAAILLAVSIFLMRWAPAKQPVAPQYGQPQAYQQAPQAPTQAVPQPPQQPQAPQPGQQANGWPGMPQQ